MNRFRKISATMKEESVKKLVAFTVLMTLLIGFIVFSAVMILNSYGRLKLLNQYIRELPKIVRDREEELDSRSRIFEEDVLARGELGMRIYYEEGGLTEMERLERIRSVISADSVSITDEGGAVLNTTGPVTSMEIFENRIRTLEPGKPDSEIYQLSSEDGQETVKKDDKAFVMFPIDGHALLMGDPAYQESERSKSASAEEPARAAGALTDQGSKRSQSALTKKPAGSAGSSALQKSEQSESAVTDGGAGRRLVFEFSCKPLMEVYNAIGEWPVILERMLSGLEAYAFVQVGEEDPIGYPLDGFTKEEREQLVSEISNVFQKSSRFFRFGSDISVKLFSFRHVPALALQMPYSEANANILLVVPLWDFVSTDVYCSATLSIFIVFNLVLFSLYVARLSGQRQEDDDREEFRRELMRTTRPGLLLLLASVSCFAFMLLMLESRSTIAYTCGMKRLSLQYEAEWHQNQMKKIRGSYIDIYQSRAEALAKFLTEHREYWTRDGLLSLCGTMKADYLMLFNEQGHEMLSSNSYTGFSVSGEDANLSGEYRAVLLGYPSIVVGPEQDPYTEKQQIGAAILLQRDNGLPDGFLLAVFDADAMNAELESSSFENTVNNFAVVKGYGAALINKEDGLFLAHTDKTKIGHDAKHYMEIDEYGDDYEGFTQYDGHEVYISGVSVDGKTLFFMVPVRPDDKEDLVAFLMITALLAIIAFIYCPRACVLCSMAVDEVKKRQENEALLLPEGPTSPKSGLSMSTPIEDEDEEIEKKNPLWIFAYGYVVFFTLLGGIGLLTAYTMIWPAFTFVFGGMWSRGLHLFSLWAVLFFLSFTLSIVLLIRMAFANAEKRTMPRTRTVLKLADSFVTYFTGILLVLGVLYMFGVNTTTLLASAGIVSIAVGMGSQSMVSDILAGMFLAIEDSIHLGDMVQIGSWKGCVTDMGIRTTKITDDSQNVMILNNSHISDVVNMSRQKTYCVLELVLERSVGMTETEKILENTVESAMEKMPELYGSLQLEGVRNISKNGFTARLSYACAEAAREAVTKRLQTFIERQVRQDMEEASEKASYATSKAVSEKASEKSSDENAN